MVSKWIRNNGQLREDFGTEDKSENKLKPNQNLTNALHQ